MSAGEAPRPDKFTWDTGIVLSQCAYCARLGTDPPGAYCTAFPGGIPEDIWLNRADHRKPWIDPETGTPGDTGMAEVGPSLTFLPLDTATPTALQSLYRKLDRIKPPGAA